MFSCLVLSFGYGQYKVNAIEVGKHISSFSNVDDGQLYFGTKSGEFGHYDGLITKVRQRLPGINHIVNDEDTIWLCTEKGLYKKYLDKIVNVSGSHLQVLDYDYKNDLIIAKQGIYTYGPNGYIPCDKDRLPLFGNIEKGKVEYVETKTYILIDNQLYSKDRWWKLERDSVISIATIKNKLFVAKINGIFMENGDSMHHINIDSTAQLLGTSDDRLYLTNNNFISEVFQDRIRNIYSLNTNDVLAFHEDRWHNIWASRSDYLYKVSPYTYDQSISLTVLEVNGSKSSIPVKLDANSQDLKIKYRGVHLTAPQHIRYQSQLEGFDEWSESTTDDEVVYENLSSGKYKYRLRATLDGENFTYCDEIEVVVVSTTASRIWMIIFAGAISFIIIAFFANQRLSVFRRKVEREKKELEDKNKLLSLEQKALKLQMNPHFIFNALNSIKGQIANGDSKSARQSITKFAHLMRCTLDISRVDLVSIEEEVNYLDQYLSLEQWINQDVFSYAIEIDESLEETIKIPTMIIQPFVENAIKHAFKNRKDKGQISVNFIKDGNNVIIKIIDDGVGMSLSNKKVHKSVAISVVKDRLAMKYPKFRGKHVIITSPTKLMTGTEVKITVPNAAI